MDLIINQDMTDYAHLILPDYKRNMAEALGLAPLTPTGTMAGQYMAFDDKMAFLVPDASRVAGGETADVQFNGRLVDYILKPNALKTFIDDEIEVPMAGVAGASLLEKARVANLLSQGANAFTVSVFDTVIAGTTPAAGKGNWDDAAVDPLAELDEGISSIEERSGISPNVLTIAKPLFRKLVKHPKVIKAFPAKVGPITKEMIALELGETDLQIEVVSGRGFRTGNLGKEGALTLPFMGNSAFLHYREPNPGPMSASFAATLAQSDAMIENVYEYTSLDGTKRFFRIRWALKTVIKSALLAYRIDKAVAAAPAAAPAA